MQLRTTLLPLCAATLMLASCGDDGTARGEGTLAIVVTAEESITEGLSTGSDEENIEDYAVTFEKYLVTFGNFRIARSRDDKQETLQRTVVVDMLNLPSGGLALAKRSNVTAGVWDQLSFETPTADSQSDMADGVDHEDHQAMIAGGYTYWIQGTVQRPANEGGPVTFDIRTAVPTRFSNCSYEGEDGLSIVENREGAATFTLHGDHIFFNAFPSAGEETVRRRSGYLLQADINKDGNVTTEELADLDVSDLFKREDGYSVSGAPLGSVLTALDFIRAQLATQGHYRGEGECDPQIID